MFFGHYQIPIRILECLSNKDVIQLSLGNKKIDRELADDRFFIDKSLSCGLWCIFYTLLLLRAHFLSTWDLLSRMLSYDRTFSARTLRLFGTAWSVCPRFWHIFSHFVQLLFFCRRAACHYSDVAASYQTE